MIKYLKSDNTGKLEAIHQKCGFMDMSGNYVINPRFDFAEPFSEGLALVSEHKHDLRCGFVDKLGNYVIRPQFDNANSFSDGLAAVDVGNWSYGFIDKTGTIVIEPQFEEIYKNFRHGFAEVGVRKESKTLPEHVIIDKRGRIVLQNMELGKYDKESGLTEVNVYKDLNRIGYIDKTGKCVINPIITYASYGFKEGIKMVLITGKWGGIDKKGNFVIKPRFDKAAWFSEGLCGVMTNNKWGFVKAHTGKEKRFTKPTLEEVQQYCKERNNTINAQHFIDFYESKGWKVGNQSMKDWKACVRTWENKEKKQPMPQWIEQDYAKQVASIKEQQEMKDLLEEFR